MPEHCRRHGFQASAWPKAGIYPLLPFSNRIRGGAFSWAGLDINLPLHPGEAHAMHGFGHRAEWQLLDCDGSSAAMLYVHGAGDSGWPWRFQAKQTISLAAGALAMKMEITNTSASNPALPPMPLGAGFHPYFPRRFARQVSFARNSYGKPMPGMSPPASAMFLCSTTTAARAALRRRKN